MRWTKKHGSKGDKTAGKSRWRAEYARKPKSEETAKHIEDASVKQTHKCTGVDVGSKAGRPVYPGRQAPPLMLWSRGEVSRYRVLLIHRWGGVLTLTSMQPKPLQPALASLVQLCQEASKAALVARFQWCVRLIAWYSNICLIFLYSAKKKKKLKKYCHR